MSFVACECLPGDLEKIYRAMGKMVANPGGKGMLPEKNTIGKGKLESYDPSITDLRDILGFVRDAKKKIVIQEFGFWLKRMQGLLLETIQDEDGDYRIVRRGDTITASDTADEDSVRRLTRDWAFVKLTSKVHDDATDQEEKDASGGRSLQGLISPEYLPVFQDCGSFNGRARPARRSYPVDRLYLWVPLSNDVVPDRFLRCKRFSFVEAGPDADKDEEEEEEDDEEEEELPANAGRRRRPERARAAEGPSAYSTLLSTVVSSVRLKKNDVTISSAHVEATPESVASRYPELGMSAEELAGWQSRTSEVPGAWAFAAEYLADSKEFLSMVEAPKKMSRRRVACSPEIDWMRDDMVKRVDTRSGDLTKWVGALSDSRKGKKV